MFVRKKIDLEHLIQVAQKKIPADLVLQNVQVINVFSNEIITSDIAIVGGTIAAIGTGYLADETIDLSGKYACPGFIDGHLHIESSMVPVPEFAWYVLPRGTTTVVVDPHEIANVMGTTGITYMLKTSKYNPLNVYMMLPSCVPATQMETAGAELKALDLFPMLQDRWVLGLGEVMNYPGVLGLHEDVLDKIKIAEGKVIDGHAPGLTGSDLNAYIAAGMKSDHECTTAQEAIEKLRLGMHIMIRQGSTTKNTRDLLPIITPSTVSRCFFVTDDCSPEELLDSGHIDRIIREAIAYGLDPVMAIRMATINTAQYFGLKNLGAIAPGYDADIVILDDLKSVKIGSVFKNGIKIAEDGKSIYKPVDLGKQLIRSSVNVKWIEEEQFKIPVKSNKFRVIELIPDQIITNGTVFDSPKSNNGFWISDIDRDLLKLVVIERHFASGRTGLGIIKGFGLRKGAVASTIAHDSHNIIAVGVDDEDIYEATVQLVRQQGGLSIALDGKVILSLPLSIGGLMSDSPLPEVRNRLDDMIRVTQQMGSPLNHPFMALSFMSLPVIPELKLTDRGLFDVASFQYVDLFLE